MSDTQLFGLVNTVPLVGWAALLLAPLRRPALVATARIVAAALAAGYVALIAVRLLTARGGADLGGLFTLAGLAHAFSQPGVMLVGWTHYLALDLWTGAWEAEDAGRRGVPHVLLVPCLLLTFLAGPAGLLLYLGARQVRGRRRAR